MKKMLSYLPLAIGISASLIYIFNILEFKFSGNTITLINAIKTLRIYLYIAIISFIIYFIIRIIMTIKYRKVFNLNENDESYEPLEEIVNKENKNDIYTPNYDYVPLYNNEEKKKEVKVVKEKVKQCFNCNKEINIKDKYCPYCGSNQKEQIKIKNPVFIKIINIIEIVILILVLYFLINMLFDYKEKQDPNFKSPIKVHVTK